MYNKEDIDFIAECVDSDIRITKEGKFHNKTMILVDSETEKREILSCINSTLKQSSPGCTICVLHVDLSTISSMNELYGIIEQKTNKNQEVSEEEGKAFVLFVFDNLDLANEKVLNGVKDMYHEGRCYSDWSFISFCRHDAKIWDVRLAVSVAVISEDVLHD